MSGSSGWPRSAVNAYGTAPCSRIHATAQQVSRPPEKAMPTRSPTGSEPRMTRPFAIVTSSASRWWRRSSSSSAPVTPSRGATKIVLSPATVPATSASAGVVDRVGERRSRSRAACGRRRALPAASSASAQRRSAAVSSLEPVAGRRRPGARRRAGRRRPRTLTRPSSRDVARDRRLHDVVARLAERLGELVLRRRAALAGRAAGSRPGARTCSRRAPPARIASAWSTRSAEMVSGGVRRSVRSPAVPTSRPALERRRRRPRPAGRSTSAREQEPAPRARSRREAPSARPAASLRAARSRAARRRARRRRRRRPRRRRGCRRTCEAWSPGTKPRGGVVGDEQRADRQPVREPLGERDERRAARRAARSRRTCRCGRRRSAPRRRRAARRARRRASRAAREELGRRAGGRRPRPGPARAGSRPCPARRRRAATRRRSACAKRDAGDERLERRRASPAGR